MGLRTVAFDGCSSLRVPDTSRNRAWPGRIRHPHGYAAYPAPRLMALAETGTRALLGAVTGPNGRPARRRRWPGGCCTAGARACWCWPTGPMTMLRVLGPGGPHRGAPADPGHRQPQPAGAPGAARRAWLSPAWPGCRYGSSRPVITIAAADGSHCGDSYRLNHHPDRSPPLSRRPAGPAVSRAVGDRIGLLRAAAHTAGLLGAALGPTGPAPNRKSGPCWPFTSCCAWP